MTRLFLRFYLGVIAILIGAWFIQGYVTSQANESQNIRVIEQALSGGARLARQQMVDAPPVQAGAVLAEVNADFEYPVQSVKFSQMELSEKLRQRLSDGEVVYLPGHVMIALKGNERALVFGPLPRFVGPSQTVVTLGFGSVLALVAIAIAILLRPVASQLARWNEPPPRLPRAIYRRELTAPKSPRAFRWPAPSTRWLIAQRRCCGHNESSCSWSRTNCERPWHASALPPT